MSGALPILITLPGVPQGKGRARFARSTGRAYTPGKTRSYEASLRIAAGEAMGMRLPLTGPVEVRVTAFLPIPASKPKKWRAAALAGQVLPQTTPDCDNYAKALDALNEIVWRDDKQITDLCVRKRFSDRPALVIEITAFDEVSS